MEEQHPNVSRGGRRGRLATEGRRGEFGLPKGDEERMNCKERRRKIGNNLKKIEINKLLAHFEKLIVFQLVKKSSDFYEAG
jgi:hypothetical protein